MGQIVGGYALFGGLDDAGPLVKALAASPLVEGLEVPFRGGIIEVPEGAPAGWRYVITMIPETMRRVGEDPRFGLASPDADGRAAALDLLREVHAAVSVSELEVVAVEVHSAPTRTADAEAFAASLADIVSWGWASTEIVVEHCDAFSDEHPVEKGFLTLAEELDAAEDAGVGVSINWARSVIETRDAATGLAHVSEAAARRLLRGVIFSSVSPEDNEVGGAWIDSHLAPAGLGISPRGTLLTAETMAQCLSVAGEAWRGFKIVLPADFDAEARAAGALEMASLVESASR